MTLDVYLDPCTVNCRKVLAGLDLMGTKFNVHNVDYFKGEHKQPAFLKINPNATVPAAVDGSTTITESNAILMYAADAAGGNAAYPKDLGQRAAVNSWLLWETSAWFPCNYVYLIENVVKPGLLQTAADQKAVAAQDETWNKLANVIETQLAKTPYLVGEAPTIADIAVASSIHLHAAQKLAMDKYPHLQSWMVNKIETLPCWQKTQGVVNKTFLSSMSSSSLSSSSSSYPNGSEEQITEVTTKLNYTKDAHPQLTELYFYESPKAQGIHEPGDDEREATIHNAWPQADSFHIDKQGFSLHDFKTDYKDKDWEDEKHVREAFYPDVVDFLKKTTGARRVEVFDHTIRSKGNQDKKLTQETNTSQRAPVMLVHCDYTNESGPLRVKQLFPDEADDLLSRRVAFINVWKPIRSTVLERPLAMCDVTSAPKDDFFKLHLRYRDRNGENYVMKYSPDHRWYYFPNMTTDKVIMLKTFDSETDGRARFVGHTAFEDPNTKPDAPMRESVEIRTIVFF